jgi:ribosomal protein S6--L-glutamate ligase
MRTFNIAPFIKNENIGWSDINPIQNNLKTVIHYEKCWMTISIKVLAVEEQRYVIQNSVTQRETWVIELTLTNRDSMGFQCFFGREQWRILVDQKNVFFYFKNSKDFISFYRNESW